MKINDYFLKLCRYVLVFLFLSISLAFTSANADEKGDLPSQYAWCVKIAASKYSIPADKLNRIISYTANHKSGIGVMGVQTEWLPVLSRYGFSTHSVKTNSCQNIVAGAWIIAYTDRIQSTPNRYRSSSKLPGSAKKWQPVIKFYAAQSGIPAPLINAVIHQESGFNEKARSKAGAIGLMQLMPDTARYLGVDPYNPIDNIRGGVAYLKELSLQFNGDLSLMLAGYNAGPGAVTKYGGVPPYGETKGYVRNVIAMYERNPVE